MCRDGAVVVRSGALLPVDGAIFVAALPWSLDPESVHVQVEGAAVGRVQLEFEAPAAHDVVDSPSSAAKEQEIELRRVETAIAALQVERQAAVQLAPGWDPEGSTPSAERLARWASLEEVVEPWVERVDSALREARKQREALSRAIHEASARTDAGERGQWDQWVPTQRARIDLVDPEPKVQVQLSYRIAGARWSPAYVLDADGGLHRGRLVMRALVAQVTDEDWSGVELTLSSGSSLRGVELPPLLPFRMGAPPPQPPAAWRALPDDFASLFEHAEPNPALGPAPEAAVPERPRVSTWSDDVDLGLAAPDDVAASTRTEGEAWSVEGLVDEEMVEITAAGRENDELSDGVPAGAAGRVPRTTDADEDDLEDTNRRFQLPDVSGLVEVRRDMGADSPAPAADSADPATESRAGTAAVVVPQVPSPDAVPADMQETAITGLTEVSAGDGDTEERMSTERHAPRPAPGVRGKLPPALLVEGPLLDFGRLRLGPHDAPSAERGRLLPADDEALLTEAGLPAAALQRLASWSGRRDGRLEELSRRPLPPMHEEPNAAAGTDVAFQADGLVDLPADGRARWVAVFTDSLDLEVKYQAVPRSDLRAYRRVRAPLVREQPLLPGPVEVYVDGALETTVSWEGSASRTSLELSLGVEDRLNLVRNVKYREELLETPTGARRFHTTVDVRVTSDLTREVRLQLIERVPVPEDAHGPEVEITTSTPIARPFLGDPDGPVLQGAKVQTLEVPAEGEARAVLGYVIGLRTGEEIAGGDRRG